MYDITDRTTFQNVQTWMTEIREYGHENINLVLIGNKVDLSESRDVPTEEAREFAEAHDMMFFETTAMNPDIKHCFKQLVGKILKDIEAGEVDPYDERNGIRVGTYVLGGGDEMGRLRRNRKKKKGCCS